VEATTQNNYGRLSAFYDWMAHLNSRGQIRACKASQSSYIGRGDRVLYVGAGSGYDAALAARQGALVTVVELSEAIVRRARRTFQRLGVQDDIELIVGDTLKHQRPGQYDAVVTNFFLDVFSEPLMKLMLAHLSAQLTPTGRLLIADFRPREGGGREQAAQQLYFGVIAVASIVLANNADHPLYDYRATLQELGFTVSTCQDFPLCGVGPRWYRTLVAERRTT